MTTIQDIPFECFDIMTLHRLSVCSKNFYGYVWKEFLLRDEGHELYKYIISLNDEHRQDIILKLPNDKLWAIIHSVADVLRKDANTLITVHDAPISMNIQYTYSYPNLHFSSHVSFEFYEIIPFIFKDIVYFTIEDCIEKVHNALNDVALYTTGITTETSNAVMDWNILPIKICMLSLQTLDIYVFNNVQFDRHTQFTYKFNDAFINNTLIQNVVSSFVKADVLCCI